MRYMVWLPLLGNIVLAVGLPALARRLSHRRGYAAVTAAAVLGASCWLWSLVLLAAVLADRLAYLRSSGGLAGAPAGLRTVPLLLTVVAAGTLVTIMIRTGRLGARQARELVHAERLARLPFVGDVIDLPDAVPRACAVGGLTGGRIAITSGLRRCLTEDEQAAVLAHERAHLAGRHHWYRMVAAWCAAVCPLLHSLPGLVEQGCERAADEAAALAIGDRRLLARALGKAALAAARAQRRPPGSGVSPAFLHGGVPDRMAALLEDPPALARAPLLSATTCLATAVVMVVATVHASVDCVALLRH